MSSRLGSPGRGVGDRGRLSERASAERAGHTGARLSRSFRARDSHRVVQQDPDSCLAAGLRRCTRLSGIPFCRGSGMPRSGARALRTARNRRIHPRRPLSAASSTHEAGLCRARRCAAEIFEGTRQGRCEGRCDRRIGRGPETAGRNLRRRDREGSSIVWVGAHAPVAMACVRGLGAIRPVAGRRHISPRGSRRPAIGSFRSSTVIRDELRPHVSAIYTGV